MLYNERVEIILQQIQLQSTVKTPELSELLHVSLDTVRRDLKAMERDGLVKCVHGGACLPETYGAFSNFKGREVIHSDLKREASGRRWPISSRRYHRAQFRHHQYHPGAGNVPSLQGYYGGDQQPGRHQHPPALSRHPGDRHRRGGGPDGTVHLRHHLRAEFSRYYPTSPFFPSTRSTIKTGLPTFACRKWTLSAFWRSMPAASSR